MMNATEELALVKRHALVSWLRRDAAFLPVGALYCG